MPVSKCCWSKVRILLLWNFRDIRNSAMSVFFSAANSISIHCRLFVVIKAGGTGNWKIFKTESCVFLKRNSKRFIDKSSCKECHQVDTHWSVIWIHWFLNLFLLVFSLCHSNQSSLVCDYNCNSSSLLTAGKNIKKTLWVFI